jgi:hypothetical protein
LFQQLHLKHQTRFSPNKEKHVLSTLSSSNNNLSFPVGASALAKVRSRPAEILLSVLVVTCTVAELIIAPLVAAAELVHLAKDSRELVPEARVGGATVVAEIGHDAVGDGVEITVSANSGTPATLRT